MTELDLNVRYPDVGEYEPGSLPQACHDELRATVEEPPIAAMLAQLVQNAGREGVAFVTSSEDGVGVMDDGESELVFAMGKDVLFPGEDEETMGAYLKSIIMRYYMEEGPADEQLVLQALVDAAVNEQNPGPP